MQLSEHATLCFPSPITSLAPSATILQEQLSTSSSERSYGSASLPLAPPAPDLAHTMSSPTTYGIIHLAPSPNGTYLAVVPANSPTSVWISAVERSVTVAVLVHHSNIRSLDWSRDAQSLLIRCTALALDRAESNVASNHAIFIWRPSKPSYPSVISVPMPMASNTRKSTLPARTQGAMAAWLPSAQGENDKQVLISGSDACGIVWVSDVPESGHAPLNYDDQTVTLGGGADVRLCNGSTGPRSLAGGDGAADDTFAFRRRPYG